MKTSRPLLIAFEGLDGSGKSTCVNWLSRQFDAEYITTPPASVRGFRDELIASFDCSQEAIQLFYLSTVFSASAQAAALLARGKSVVIDRYFLSTQAYAAFRGSTLRIDDIERYLLPADITVFLDVPLDVRRQRLHSRDVFTAEDRETLSESADFRLREEHFQRASRLVVGDFVCVDGSRPQEDVGRRVIAELGMRGWLDLP